MATPSPKPSAQVEKFWQAPVEEQQKPGQESRKSNPLDGRKALVHHEHAPEQQEHGRKLDDGLGHRRRRVLERECVQEIVAHQAEQGDQHEYPAAPWRGSPVRELTANSQHHANCERREKKPVPADRIDIHAFENNLQGDWHDAPEERSDQRER